MLCVLIGCLGIYLIRFCLVNLPLLATVSHIKRLITLVESIHAFLCIFVRNGHDILLVTCNYISLRQIRIVLTAVVYFHKIILRVLGQYPVVVFFNIVLHYSCSMLTIKGPVYMLATQFCQLLSAFLENHCFIGPTF